MTKRREAGDLGRFVRHPAGFAAFRGNVFPAISCLTGESAARLEVPSS